MRLLPCDWRTTAAGELKLHPEALGGRQAEIDRAVKCAHGALNAIAYGAAAGALMGLLITGPHGVGKTAVAEAIASELRRNSSTCQLVERKRGVLSAGVPIWTLFVPAESLLTASQPSALLARLRALLERLWR